MVGTAPTVGLSRRTVKPRLLIACGVSVRSIYRGNESSEMILSINNDPHAAINQIANYSFIGDLYQIIRIIEVHQERERAMNYKKMDEKDIAFLRDVCGEDRVILGKDIPEDYCHDEMEGQSAAPEVMVFVLNATEVSLIYIMPTKKDPGYSRGQGTGLVVEPYRFMAEF
jgi:hypothetical protein